MSGNLHLNGTASIDYIVASYESSSIIYSSGSTKFGDTLDDTHEFTGSVQLQVLLLVIIGVGPLVVHLKD
jgi:hypothetical protein